MDLELLKKVLFYDIESRINCLDFEPEIKDTDDKFIRDIKEKRISEAKQVFDSLLKITYEELSQLIWENTLIINYGDVCSFLEKFINNKTKWEKLGYTSEQLKKLEEKLKKLKDKKSRNHVLQLRSWYNQYGKENIKAALMRQSAQDRQGKKMAIMLYFYRNPEQRLFSKEEYENILNAIREADKDCKEKIIPLNVAIMQRIPCYSPCSLDIPSIDSYRKLERMLQGIETNYELLLEFFLVMDIEEIIHFITIDIFNEASIATSKQVLIRLKEKAQELGRDELIKKCKQALTAFDLKENGAVYGIVDAYNEGNLYNYIIEYSSEPDVRYGLRNQIILYDYRHPNHTLFNERDLARILGVFQKIESNSPRKRTPLLELAKKPDLSLKQKHRFPKSHYNWSDFKSLLSTTSLINTSKYSYDEEKINALLECFAIMEVDELVNFMIECYNLNLDKILSQFQKRLKLAGKPQYATKIDEARKLYRQRIINDLNVYKQLFVSGSLSQFVLTLSESDRNNLKDFLRLSRTRYAHDLFDDEELKQIIEIIEKTKPSSKGEQLLSNIKTRLVGAPRPQIELSKVLGTYNRTRLKEILKERDPRNLICHIPTILEFFSIMSSDEIAGLMAKETINYGVYSGAYEELKKLIGLEEREDIILKIDTAINIFESQNERKKISISREQMELYLTSGEHNIVLYSIVRNYLDKFYQCAKNNKENPGFVAQMLLDFIINIEDDTNIESYLTEVLYSLGYISIDVEGIPIVYFAKREDLRQLLINKGFKESEHKPNSQMIEEIRNLVSDSSGKKFYKG